MVTHVKIYDTNGVMFEVTPLNARDLVNHAGWSFTPPTTDKTEKPFIALDNPTADLSTNQKSVDNTPIVSKVEDVEPLLDPFEGLEVMLEGMTKKEILAYALETFGKKLDGRANVEDLITQVLTLAKKI